MPERVWQDAAVARVLEFDGAPRINDRTGDWGRQNRRTDRVEAPADGRRCRHAPRAVLAGATIPIHRRPTPAATRPTGRIMATRPTGRI